MARPLVEQGGVFLGASAGWEESRVVLVGVPLDVTTSFRPGTRFAPQRIREVSKGLEENSYSLGRDLRDAGLHDAGDLVLTPGDVNHSLDRIQDCVSWLVGAGKKPGLIGGEHLLTYPAVKALTRFFEGLTVIQCDAHADRRQDYLGLELSHATVMHLVGRLGVPVYQMGIRSVAKDELASVRSMPGHLLAPDFLAGMMEAVPQLRDRPVYLSCDIDVLDPAYAPGTGAPEPGGITSREIFAAIEHLQGLNLVGFDVVEVNPLVDVGDCTSLLAAKVIRELLLSCAWFKT